jgi:hypothetical protein
MKRKNIVIGLNAAIGPTLVVLTLVAHGSEQIRPLVTRADGGMRDFVAIILALAAIYSLGFQLWLAKLFWQPRINRAFNQTDRR